MDEPTPGFSKGCARLGVFDLSPTLGGTGGRLPAPEAATRWGRLSQARQASRI